MGVVILYRFHKPHERTSYWIKDLNLTPNYIHNAKF